MPVQKRPAAKVVAETAVKDVAPPGKRAKLDKAAAKPKQPKVDPIVRQVTEIIKGFGAASVTTSVAEMLKAMLPFALAAHAGDRDKHQQTIVELADGILGEAEANLEAGISEEQAAIAKMEESSPDVQAAVESARRAFEGEEAEMALKKATLAEDARAFRVARARAEQAKSEAASVLMQQQAAASQRQRLLAVECEAKALAEAADGPGGEDGASASRLEAFVAGLVSLGLDASMMAAVPNAFGKPAVARGSFDTMVIAQVLQTLADRLASAAVAESDFEPQRAAAADAVGAADGAFDEAKAAQLASAKAFQEAVKQQDAATATLREAERAAKAHTSQRSALARKERACEGRLDKFRGGPLAAFVTLRDQTAPALGADGTEAAEAVLEKEAEPAIAPVTEPVSESLAEPAAAVGVPAGDLLIAAA